MELGTRPAPYRFPKPITPNWRNHMTSKEAVELLQTAVDDEIRSLQDAPEKEWAECRVSQLNEAMDMARDAIYGRIPAMLTNH